MRLCEKIPYYLKQLIYTHNFDTERRLRDRGDNRDVMFITCDGLTKNETLMNDMRDILSVIQSSYEYPVDTEFTINFAPDGSYVIDLLQCRPLQLTKDGDKVTIPECEKADILLETKGVSMGFSREIKIDCVVYIDPIAYYNMPYKQKYNIKQALSQVNWYYQGKNKHLLLLTTGRICTSSPELGVPSAFSDISEFSVIAEISESRARYIPELSYGSHIFQGLVEAGILYTAVFEKKSTAAYTPDTLSSFNDIRDEITNVSGDIGEIIHVYDTSGGGLSLYYDMGEEHLLICKK